MKHLDLKSQLLAMLPDVEEMDDAAIAEEYAAYGFDLAADVRRIGRVVREVGAPVVFVGPRAEDTVAAGRHAGVTVPLVAAPTARALGLALRARCRLVVGLDSGADRGVARLLRCARQMAPGVPQLRVVVPTPYLAEAPLLPRGVAREPLAVLAVGEISADVERRIVEQLGDHVTLERLPVERVMQAERLAQGIILSLGTGPCAPTIGQLRTRAPGAVLLTLSDERALERHGGLFGLLVPSLPLLATR